METHAKPVEMVRAVEIGRYETKALSCITAAKREKSVRILLLPYSSIAPAPLHLHAAATLFQTGTLPILALKIPFFARLI